MYCHFDPVSIIQVKFMIIIMQTNIVYLNSVAGKDPKNFPNPTVFDPERWARDKPHPFALLLFGFGPRGCYGEQNNNNF